MIRQSIIALAVSTLLLATLACSTRKTLPAPTVDADPRFDAGHPVIVRMIGRTGTLTVSSTPLGPAYSVVSPTGETLLANGSLEDLRRLDPALYRYVRTGLAHDDSGTFLDASGPTGRFGNSFDMRVLTPPPPSSISVQPPP